MLKNKLKIIAILSIIILALTLPIVRAVDENADISAPVVTSEGINNEATDPTADPANGNIATPATSDENFKKSDVYLSGDDVTIDYIVDGNLFVFANNVTINSQIGGDAFICASNVTIGEQGYVFSNLFTLSKTVDIKGVVYDLYAASQSTTIDGYIYRDAHIGSDIVNIFGTVGRDAHIGCNSINFVKDTNSDSKGVINGNLEYSAENELAIPEGSVTGETKFEKETSFEDNSIQDTIMRLGTFVVTVVVIWLLCLWLAPKFLKNADTLLTTKKVLPVIGFGILAPIAGIVIAVALFILGLTTTLAFLLLAVLFTLIAISTSIFVITINNIICKKLKMEKTLITLGMLIVSSIVLWLIGLIPYLGTFIGLIAVVLGLGIILSSIILKEKEITE